MLRLDIGQMDRPKSILINCGLATKIQLAILGYLASIKRLNEAVTCGSSHEKEGFYEAHWSRVKMDEPFAPKLLY
jgi:hypothetical protein